MLRFITHTRTVYFISLEIHARVITSLRVQWMLKHVYTFTHKQIHTYTHVNTYTFKHTIHILLHV
jgi:hypothetical protein